jgi:cobalt-zinc-cadmium efflux system outer membrane protein
MRTLNRNVLALALAGCVPSSGALVRDDVRARIHEEIVANNDSSSVQELLAQPMGPQEATRVALLHSPRARMALDELGIAQADLLGDSLLPNPELDSETRVGRDSAGDEIEAHAVIDVTALITLPLRRAAAEAELEAAQLRSANELLGIAYEARTTFVEYQAAIELQRLSEANVAATRASFEAAQVLFDAGNVPAVDVALEESLYQESRLALVEAELEVLELREHLQVLMGLSGDETDWQSTSGLSAIDAQDPSLESLEERAVAQSLAIGEAEQHLVALARRHGVARMSGLVPDLRAGVSGSLADNVLAFGPAISITLPLFDQGEARADRIEAELDVERQRYVGVAIEVRSRVRRARNRLVNARERSRFIQESLLPARARALEQTLLQYNAMAATPFQLLQVRRDQIEAAREEVRARRDYWLARAALERTLAGGSDTMEQP